MTEEVVEMLVKVILIGDSSVGKTNIMTKYLKNEFKEDSKATVGVEFGSKNFTIEGHSIKAQIWDTAGQERYRSITNAYYKGAKGAFVVYDITRKETFSSIDKWITDLRSSADKKINIILIGNKTDLEQNREVTKEQGSEKSKAFGVAFMETSANNGENIEQAFDEMMQQVFNIYRSEIKKEEELAGSIEGQNINVDSENKGEGKKGCC